MRPVFEPSAAARQGDCSSRLCGVRQIIGQVQGAVSGTPARAKHLWTGAREPWKTSGTGPGPQLPCHFLPRTCPSA